MWKKMAMPWLPVKKKKSLFTCTLCILTHVGKFVSPQTFFSPEAFVAVFYITLPGTLISVCDEVYFQVA